MRKYFYIFVVLVACSLAVNGQNISVSGRLMDKENQPLVGATVVLSSELDTTQFKYRTSNQTGFFQFTGISSGSYKIKISFIGFEEWQKEFKQLNKSINLGDIILTPKVSILTELEVVSSTVPVHQKGDTTEYNANAYKTKPDATAEELLEKMPGMVKKDGKIQVQGEDVKQVLVDGQPFFGDDPNAALKNIPSEIIAKIEVFDQQSEQSKFTGFDDGNTVKTINIVTKQEFANGKFGNGYAGAGYENKYTLGGVANSFKKDQRITVLGQFNNINLQNFATEDLAGVVSSSSNSKGRGSGRPGGGSRSGSSSSSDDVNDFLVGEQDGITSTNAFGVNYTDKIGKKLNLTASYFFNQGNNESAYEMHQKFFSTESNGQEYYEKEEAESQNINHRVNLRLDYKINQKNSIFFSPKLSWQLNDGKSNSVAKTIVSDSTLNNVANTFNSNIETYEFSNSLLWRHKFNKRGRTFSIDLSQEVKSNNAESYLNSLNAYYTTQQLDTIIQNAHLEQYEQLYSARITYTEPFSKKTILMLNYIPSVSINSSDKRTNNYDSISQGYNQIDTLLSNISESYYTTHKIGTGIRLRKGKSVFMLSAFYQLANLKSNQILPDNSSINTTFENVLPMAVWRWRLSPSKNVRVLYRTNTLAPSISQLQEVVDNSNPVQLKIGNASLQQEYNHSVFLKYTTANTDKNTVFFALLSGSIKNNYIGNNTTIAYKPTTTSEGIVLEPGTQLSRLTNLNGYFSIRGLITYGMPLKKIKSNLNFNISADFNQTPGIINEEQNLVSSPIIGLVGVMSSNISDKIDFTFGTSSSISFTMNSLNTVQNSKYFVQSTSGKFYYNFYKKWTFRTDITHQYYSEFSGDLSTNYFLWNLSIGSKLFKNQRGELTLTLFDVLNQNTSISRVTTETYIQNSESMVLNRYVLLRFKYRFLKV